MSNTMYTVEKRYEYRIRGGVKWTSWFRIKEFDTEEDAKEYIAKSPKKILKLKHEYQIKG